MNKRSFLFVIGLTIAFYFVNQWFFPSTPKPQTEVVSPPTAVKEVRKSKQVSQEDYYVIENAYQQIVFSSAGGAVAEINLLLHSKENPTSPVLPTGFDRLFKEDYQKNDFFPAFPYTISENGNLKKVEERTLGGYYPLLRRTLFGSREGSYKSPTPYYALRVVSDEGELQNVPFRLKTLEKDQIAFEFSDSKRRITKTYAFPKNEKEAPYCLDVTLQIDGDTEGLWITSGVPEVELISNSAAPAMSYSYIKNSGKWAVENLSLPKECTISSVAKPRWTCNANGFFGLIIDPLEPIPEGYKACKISGNQDPTRLSAIDPEYTPYPAESYPGYEFQLPLKSGTTHFRYYAGPLQTDLLRLVDKAFTDPETGGNPHYILALSFHGWFTFISEPFAQFLFILLTFFHKITSSWGFSIILLTVALRIMLYPLNAWSIKSTLKMQEIAPRVSAIQAKHKKEPKKAQKEVMMLYKERGVNPLSGCFPLLIQLPFLIGMFDLLKSSFELRGASFIPGWINNLTAPDVVFSWQYPLPFFGNQFHLLPLILGGVMWIQQRFSATAPKDKSMMTDQQKQQKMMGNIMTVVFAVMFYNFPSGLNLYWLSSMSLGIVQQWWMNRKIKAAK